MYPPSILYPPSLEITDVEKQANLKQIINESKIVEPTELVFNHTNFSEKLQRPMQVIGQKRKSEILPEFLEMEYLPRTQNDELEECTFLAGMALNHKDYQPKPIVLKDSPKSNHEAPKIPQITDEEASEKSSDHEDADPLTDDQAASVTNGVIAHTEPVKQQTEEVSQHSENQNEGVHRVIHKKNGTLIFTKADTYDHQAVLKRQKKSRAKFFENGQIDDVAGEQSQKAEETEQQDLNQISTAPVESETTIILQKFSENGQEFYKLEEEFEKPSQQLRFSDGRAKLLIQREKKVTNLGFNDLNSLGFNSQDTLAVQQ